jgi:hypothetical protein
LSLAAICAALFLIAGIDTAGIWDPYELERAELARRIAIHVFGAKLQVPGALNGMPTLSDLESGELGYVSMAAGFAVWGLHDFAGRLPMALWAFVGALALFVFLARVRSPRAGLFGVVVLVTMPTYFVQARAMLGDAAALASFALCFFGFAAALIEDDGRAAAVMSVVGVVGGACGFLSRGWLLGVVAPCGGVGLSWLALLGAGERRWRRTRRAAVGAAALAIAAVGAWRGMAPLVAHGHALDEVRRAVGVSVLPSTAPESTFDLYIRELGHGLFPWSAFLPFAFGLMLSRRDDTGVRTLLLVGGAAAYGVHAALGPFTGPLPFVGVAVLAAIIGLVVDELDAHYVSRLRVVGVGTMMLLAVLAHDRLADPEEGLAAFAIAGAELPPGIGTTLDSYVFAASAMFVALLVLTFAMAPLASSDGSTLRTAVRERLARYEEIASELSKIWAGNLSFGFLVLEAALLGMGATLLIGRRMGWSSVVGMSRSWAYVGLNLWWVVPLALVTVPLAIDVAVRGYGMLLNKLRAPRSLGMLVAALASGATLCFGYYDAMAEQLSPKGALDAYAKRHGRGEPLGLLGVSSRVGRYYAGSEQTMDLSGPRAAIRWLAESGDGPPRWLAFRDAKLAELNALHRRAQGDNLVMVPSGSEQILLATSARLAGNANPLAPFVRSKPPERIQHPVEARFGDQLRLLGWEIVDEEGQPVERLEAGEPYRMRVFLHVEDRIARSFQAFIHVDAPGQRYNGDHPVVGGRYPMTFWEPGDYIVDEHELTLPRHFKPGRHTVFLGFFIFKERLAVTEGRHHEDRLIAGSVVVE